MPESIKIQDHIVLQVTDPIEALRILATTTMRPFTKEDWYGFAGCETKEPMIGIHGDFFTIVLDGSSLIIVHNDDYFGGTLFELIGRN